MDIDEDFAILVAEPPKQDTTAALRLQMIDVIEQYLLEKNTTATREELIEVARARFRVLPENSFLDLFGKGLKEGRTSNRLRRLNRHEWHHPMTKVAA